MLGLYEIYTTSVQLGKQLQCTVEVFHQWKSDQPCPGRAGGDFLGEGPFELDLEDEVVLEVSSKGTSRK